MDGSSRSLSDSTSSDSQFDVTGLPPSEPATKGQATPASKKIDAVVIDKIADKKAIEEKNKKTTLSGSEESVDSSETDSAAEAQFETQVASNPAITGTVTIRTPAPAQEQKKSSPDLNFPKLLTSFETDPPKFNKQLNQFVDNLSHSDAKATLAKLFSSFKKTPTTLEELKSNRLAFVIVAAILDKIGPENCLTTASPCFGLFNQLKQFCKTVEEANTSDIYSENYKEAFDTLSKINSKIDKKVIAQEKDEQKIKEIKFVLSFPKLLASFETDSPKEFNNNLNQFVGSLSHGEAKATLAKLFSSFKKTPTTLEETPLTIQELKSNRLVFVMVAAILDKIGPENCLTTSSPCFGLFNQLKQFCKTVEEADKSDIYSVNYKEAFDTLNKIDSKIDKKVIAQEKDEQKIKEAKSISYRLEKPPAVQKNRAGQKFMESLAEVIHVVNDPMSDPAAFQKTIEKAANNFTKTENQSETIDKEKLGDLLAQYDKLDDAQRAAAFTIVKELIQKFSKLPGSKADGTFTETGPFFGVLGALQDFCRKAALDPFIQDIFPQECALLLPALNAQLSSVPFSFSEVVDRMLADPDKANELALTYLGTCNEKSHAELFKELTKRINENTTIQELGQITHFLLELDKAVDIHTTYDLATQFQTILNKLQSTEYAWKKQDRANNKDDRIKMALTLQTKLSDCIKRAKNPATIFTPFENFNLASPVDDLRNGKKLPPESRDLVVNGLVEGIRSEFEHYSTLLKVGEVILQKGSNYTKIGELQQQIVDFAQHLLIVCPYADPDNAETILNDNIQFCIELANGFLKDGNFPALVSLMSIFGQVNPNRIPEKDKEAFAQLCNIASNAKLGSNPKGELELAIDLHRKQRQNMPPLIPAFQFTASQIKLTDKQNRRSDSCIYESSIKDTPSYSQVLNQLQKDTRFSQQGPEPENGLYMGALHPTIYKDLLENRPQTNHAETAKFLIANLNASLESTATIPEIGKALLKNTDSGHKILLSPKGELTVKTTKSKVAEKEDIASLTHILLLIERDVAQAFYSRDNEKYKAALDCYRAFLQNNSPKIDSYKKNPAMMSQFAKVEASFLLGCPSVSALLGFITTTHGVTFLAKGTNQAINKKLIDAATTVKDPDDLREIHKIMDKRGVAIPTPVITPAVIGQSIPPHQAPPKPTQQAPPPPTSKAPPKPTQKDYDDSNLEDS